MSSKVKLDSSNITRGLADFIVNTKAESIPDAAITTVKRVMLDSLGVTLAGSSTDIGEKLQFFANKFLGSGDVCVPGITTRLSCPDAALITGSIMHTLDYDDTGAFSQGHPSASVFPVVYSLSQITHVSGTDAIVSYCIGVETLSRFSRSMPMMHLKGWHPTGLIGSFAATATAARLLHLTEKETINALGISASLASGIVQNFGTMSKPLQAGNSVRNGVTSALLAMEGFTSSGQALEGDVGFLNTYYGTDNNASEWFNDFDSELVITSPGINIKRYASCALTHRSIDGVLELQAKYNFSADDVESVCCFVPPRATKVLFYTQPENGLQARFSINYVITAALLFQKVGPFEFEVQQFKKVKQSDLLYNVKMQIHPDWEDGDDARPDVVRIRLKNGNEYELSIKFPRGNVANPLSWNEIVDKFEDCVQNTLSAAKIKKSISFIKELQSQNDFSNLIRIIRS